MEGLSTFTCMGDWHGAPVFPITRKEWEEARRRPSLIEQCRLIEAGNEELKRRLPVWTPHCGLFANNHRSIADALKPLPRLMLDFDEKGHSAEILEKAKGKKIGELQSQLKSINGVSSCKVDPSFFWVTTIPNDANKITVNLEVEK